jgi:hypothetical protein
MHQDWEDINPRIVWVMVPWATHCNWDTQEVEIVTIDVQMPYKLYHTVLNDPVVCGLN